MVFIQKEIIINNKQGLHARPAAIFVQIANKFEAQITVRRADSDEKVNGKSIMGILTLGAEKGSMIIIEADGLDAQSAISELEKVVNSQD